MRESTEALKHAHERLQNAVESIVTGDDWQKMLQGPPSVGPRTSAATSGGIRDGLAGSPEVGRRPGHVGDTGTRR